jgi:hypothetical protein
MRAGHVGILQASFSPIGQIQSVFDSCLQSDKVCQLSGQARCTMGFSMPIECQRSESRD